jgi:hypothetical protein
MGGYCQCTVLGAQCVEERATFSLIGERAVLCFVSGVSAVLCCIPQPSVKTHLKLGRDPSLAGDPCLDIMSLCVGLSQQPCVGAGACVVVLSWSGVPAV